MGAAGGRTAPPSRSSFFFPDGRSAVECGAAHRRLTRSDTRWIGWIVDPSFHRPCGKQRSAGDGEGTTANCAAVAIVLTAAALCGRMKGGPALCGRRLVCEKEKNGEEGLWGMAVLIVGYGR